MAGLFGKKKDEEDLAQTSQIREASSAQTLSPPSQMSPPLPDFSLEQNHFNNPFAIDDGSIKTNSQEYVVNTSTPSFPNRQDGQVSNQVQMPMQPQKPTNSTLPKEKFDLSREEIEEMIDEVVEKVIDERWKGIVEKIEKVVSWKDKQEAHINMIKEDIVTVKEAFESLEKKLIAKIGDYDKNILDVNSEIKALEKVFQKITPTLVNNVNELSRITRSLKGEDRDGRTETRE